MVQGKKYGKFEQAGDDLLKKSKARQGRAWAGADVAEGEGFEPSMALRPFRFSRPADSTTLAPFRGCLMKILLFGGLKYIKNRRNLQTVPTGQLKETLAWQLSTGRSSFCISC